MRIIVLTIPCARARAPMLTLNTTKAVVEEVLVCKREPEHILIDTLCMAVKKKLSQDICLENCHRFVRCFSNREAL